MNEIDLNNQNLTEFSENDLIALCQLKGFEFEKLTHLWLGNNKLTHINFIQENTPFINLRTLLIANNKNLKNITNVKYLHNLEYLGISDLNLKDEYETVEILKTFKKLNYLRCLNTFKTYTEEQLKKELFDINII